jgi:NTE family protein
VPATPAWRVRDALAHVVGITADMHRLDFGLDDPDGWTARLVGGRRGRTVDELATEWEQESVRFEEGALAVHASGEDHVVGSGPRVATSPATRSSSCGRSPAGDRSPRCAAWPGRATSTGCSSPSAATRSRGTTSSTESVACAPMAHGVVFGGGGVLGISWEVGVVAGLAAAGVDPLVGASAVVGTSAGSVVGSRLAGGVPVELLEKEQLAPAGDGAEAATVLGSLDFQLLADVFARWTGSGAVDEAVARDVGTMALRQTTLTQDAFVARLADELHDVEWPECDLRVVTSSCDTGARTAWTRADAVPLARAVAASCSIPGIMPPVAVDPASSERHVDGGVWSGTNADLLVADGLDTVVVIEPLSVATNQLGELSGQALAREVAALDAGGTRVVVISGDTGYAALSGELLDPAKRPEALELGRDTGAAAADAVRGLLAAAR